MSKNMIAALPRLGRSGLGKERRARTKWTQFILSLCVSPLNGDKNMRHVCPDNYWDTQMSHGVIV